MSNALYEWFVLEDSDFRSQDERDFANALVIHASKWTEFGISSRDGLLHFGEEFFTIAIDVSDQTKPCILRTLRVDYYGDKILLGDDETGQLVTKLDSSWRNVTTHIDVDGTPESFAKIAAAWLEKEMARIIERHEWRSHNWFGKKWCHQHWIFQDTGQGMIWSDTQNQKRTDLRAPYKITVVYPLSEVNPKDIMPET